jgi:hypothetical protein
LLFYQIMAYLSTVFNYTIPLFSAIIARRIDLCPEWILEVSCSTSLESVKE